MGKGRAWLAWHSWIGVTAGLLLFVICWSGTVAVLSPEIDWLLEPAQRLGTPWAGVPRWQTTLEAVERALPGHSVTTIVPPAALGDAAHVLAEDANGTLVRVYVDPYRAQVTGVRSYFNVQRFFRSFHMNLFFNTGPWGYYVVCALSVPLLASAVTALFFYRRWWRRWLVLKWDRGPAVFWSDLHKTGGLWSLWFVVLIGLTGVWYFVEAAGLDMGYPEVPRFAERPVGHRLPVDDLLQRAQATWPELQIRVMSLPGGYWGEAFVVEGQAGDVLVRDRANKVYLDPATGEVLARQRAADLPLAARWVDMADPLHFGNFAGLPVKLLWFAFGLLLSGLSLMGAYLHVQRQHRRRQGDARRAGVTAAYLISSAILVAAAVGGWLEVRGYGSIVAGVRQWPRVPLPVIGFLSAWVLVTLGIVAVWMRKLR